MKGEIVKMNTDKMNNSLVWTFAGLMIGQTCIQSSKKKTLVKTNSCSDELFQAAHWSSSKQGLTHCNKNTWWSALDMSREIRGSGKIHCPMCSCWGVLSVGLSRFRHLQRVWSSFFSITTFWPGNCRAFYRYIARRVWSSFFLCVCMCVTMKKSARRISGKHDKRYQCTILQVSSSKHNAKKTTTT